LSIRKPEKLPRARETGCSKEQAEIFYDNLIELFGKHGFQDHPSAIYNMDETGFTLVHEPSKIVGQKGARMELVSLLFYCSMIKLPWIVIIHIVFTSTFPIKLGL